MGEQNFYSPMIISLPFEGRPKSSQLLIGTLFPNGTRFGGRCASPGKPPRPVHPIHIPAPGPRAFLLLCGSCGFPFFFQAVNKLIQFQDIKQPAGVNAHAGYSVFISPLVEFGAANAYVTRRFFGVEKSFIHYDTHFMFLSGYQLCSHFCSHDVFTI